MNKSSLGFLGSIAQAIVSICMALIQSMTVVQKAVNMADAAVSAAQEDQAIDLEIKRINYATNAVNHAALKLAQQEEAMEQYASTENRKDLLEKHRKHLEGAVNKRLASLKQSA